MNDAWGVLPSDQFTGVEMTAPERSSSGDRRATALPASPPPSMVAVTVTVRAVAVAAVPVTEGSRPVVVKVTGPETVVPRRLVATTRRWCTVRGARPSTVASRDSLAAPLSASSSTLRAPEKSDEAETSARTEVRRSPGWTVSETRAVVPPTSPTETSVITGSVPSVVNVTGPPVTVPCSLVATTRAWYVVRGEREVSPSTASTGRYLPPVMVVPPGRLTAPANPGSVDNSTAHVVAMPFGLTAARSVALSAVTSVAEASATEGDPIGAMRRGKSDLVRSPVPATPQSLPVQHQMREELSIAHVVASPTEMRASVTPAGRTGRRNVLPPRVVPVPSSPKPPRPQHHVVPEVPVPHVWYHAVCRLTSASPSGVSTRRGVRLSVYVPSPNEPS